MQQRRWASSGGNSTYLLCHRHNLHPFSSFPYSLTGGDCNFPCKWDCCDERLDVDHLEGGSDGLGASDLVWIILPWTWCLRLDRRLRCKTWVRLAAGEWSQAPYFFILIFFMSRTLHPHLLHLRLPFPLELKVETHRPPWPFSEIDSLLSQIRSNSLQFCKINYGPYGL